MRYLFILLLTGCVTERESAVDLSNEHKQLKCIGYCDLLITDKNIEVKTNGKIDVGRNTGNKRKRNSPKPDPDNE